MDGDQSALSHLARMEMQAEPIVGKAAEAAQDTLEGSQSFHPRQSCDAIQSYALAIIAMLLPV